MNKKNILSLLNQREYDGVWRETVFYKALFKSDQRKHELSWCKQKSDGMISFDGNLYLSSYKEWFPGCFHEFNKPHIMKLDLSNHVNNRASITRGRIKGTLRFQSPKTDLNDVNGLENGNFIESLFLLTSLSYLIQYKLHQDEWKFHCSVFLSSKYSFEHIDYDVELERFHVKSKRLPTRASPDVLYCFTLFSMAPLNFIGSFVLKKSIFGNIKEAYLRCGLLVLLLKENTYHVFNLEEIIQKYTKRTYKIGQVLSPEETQIMYNFPDNQETACIGSCPWGFPLTIDIIEMPTVLYKFSSEHKSPIGEFSFGGYPWACLVNKRFSTDFIIYSLANSEKLTEFCESEILDEFPIDENHSFYHSDNSGRILCITGEKVRCFRLRRTSANKYNIEVIFTISFESIEETQQVQPRYSRYGRSLSTSRLTEGARTLSSEIIHAIDYHEVLDALAVLYTKQNHYYIGFYDNQDGRFLRNFCLEESVADNDGHMWSLFLNDFVVVCVLRYVGANSKNKCYIYQLVHSSPVCSDKL